MRSKHVINAEKRPRVHLLNNEHCTVETNFLAQAMEFPNGQAATLGKPSAPSSKPTPATSQSAASAPTLTAGQPNLAPALDLHRVITRRVEDPRLTSQLDFAKVQYRASSAPASGLTRGISPPL
jgi:hypothetical protein